MIGDFIAPIGPASLQLLSTSFDVEPEGPAEDAVTTVAVDHSFGGLQTDESGAIRFAEIALSVLTEIREEGEGGKIYMRGSVDLRGVFACGASEEHEDADLERWILTNGISMLYAHARSHFKSLASQSPMGDFLLPPIYVHEYLRTCEDDCVGAVDDDG